MARHIRFRSRFVPIVERIRALPVEAGVLDLSRREDIAAVEQRLSEIDATP